MLLVKPFSVFYIFILVEVDHSHRHGVSSEDTILIKNMCEGLDCGKKRNQSNHIKNHPGSRVALGLLLSPACIIGISKVAKDLSVISVPILAVFLTKELQEE